MYEIFPIPAFNDNYIWAIIHPNVNQCIIVDPGDAAPVIDFLEQKHLKMDAILITHHHWDHTGGIPELVKHHEVKVYGPASDHVSRVDFHLKEGDQIEFKELKLEFSVLDIPGHTAGHIAFYNDKIAFTGDTLFTAGCGRLFEGTAEQMYQSLEKLKKLSPSIQVYCGHEYTEDNLKFAKLVEPNNKTLQQRIKTTREYREHEFPTVPAPLALELQTNPFLRCQEPEVDRKSVV